eukprot:sb/3470058/
MNRPEAAGRNPDMGCGLRGGQIEEEKETMQLGDACSLEEARKREATAGPPAILGDPLITSLPRTENWDITTKREIERSEIESIRTLTSSDFSETSHMLKYDNGGTNTAYFRSETFLVRQLSLIEKRQKWAKIALKMKHRDEKGNKQAGGGKANCRALTRDVPQRGRERGGERGRGRGVYRSRLHNILHSHTALCIQSKVNFTSSTKDLAFEGS